MKKPNVIIVFGDQWRAQAMGYNGNNIVQTPVLDELSEKSVNFANAIAGVREHLWKNSLDLAP